jgi:hypothetical protein
MQLPRFAAYQLPQASRLREELWKQVRVLSGDDPYHGSIRVSLAQIIIYATDLGNGFILVYN